VRTRTRTGQSLPGHIDRTGHDKGQRRTKGKEGQRTKDNERTKDKEALNGIIALGFSVGEADEQTPLARSLLMAEVTASPTVSRGQIIWPGLARNRTTFQDRIN
jgi:hypothetical protein